MLKKLTLLILVFLSVISCTDLHLRRQSKNAHTIITDKVGTKWIDVQHGACTVRILSFQHGHLRLSVQNPQSPQSPCEPGISPLIEVAAPAAKILMDSYNKPLRQLQLDMAMASSPTLIRKWELFLKQNQQWQSRPIPKNPWDNSEYPLIKSLLERSDVFSSYAPLFSQFPQLKNKSLHIEKVHYETASKLPDFDSTLRAAGYMPQERIPIPMVITMELR